MQPILPFVQRWRDGRDSYRPAGETIRPAEFEVAAIASDEIARAFVTRHHYARSFPAARFRFGLYRHGQLAGVAVFSVPVAASVLTSVFPGPLEDSTELGRFVLLDDVRANGETWFLARCFEQLRRDGLRGVVSFSDPVARTTADGRQIFPGHIGTIYQAHNARYTGRATPRTLRLLPDGQVFSARTMQKIRARDRGWQYGVEQLLDAGAPAPHDREDLRAWLRLALARVTRTMRHPGNHRYAWPLSRRTLIALPALPYPKRHTASSTIPM